jgi:arginase
MEKPQVRDSGIRAFTMRDIDERGCAVSWRKPSAIAAEGTAGLHLSLDMDFCDPVDAPGSAHRSAGAPPTAKRIWPWK